jgi:LysR family transcriptional regulator, nitrogen assimilation regulatory protein
METRALRYFQAVAEHGSYSRAAESLRISQPAISRTIRQLEEELGCLLFRRHGHGVSLTDAGQVLFERSQNVLRQIEQAKADIRANAAGPAGTIAVALPPAAGTFLAPLLIERFGAEFPNVFLKLIGGFSGYIHEWLVRGQVDLACIHDPLPQRGFEVTPLVSEEVFLVGRPGAARFPRKHVRTEDLLGLPLILPSRPNASRRLLDSWVGPSGAALRIAAEVDDHTISRALVRQGIGFTLLTRGAFEADLKRGEVEAWPFRPSARWPLAMIRSTHGPPSAIIDAFASTLRAVARDLVATGRWPGRSLDG